MSVTIHCPNSPSNIVPCYHCAQGTCFDFCPGEHEFPEAPEVNFSNANMHNVMSPLGWDYVYGSFSVKEVPQARETVVSHRDRLIKERPPGFINLYNRYQRIITLFDYAIENGYSISWG